MAQEIRFVEEFALAADRAAVLEQLVPGTDDWFYFTCLLLQQQGRLEAVDETLARWRDQTGGSGQIAEIENRQVLLKTDPATKTGWDELADKLGLWFGHAREQLDAQAALPTRLEPAGQFDRATLLTRAFNANPNSVRGIEDSGLEWLATESFKPDRRRDLLRRLTRPDAPNLVRLIADDLAHGSVRFGDFAIHRALTLKQLEELAALRKGLIDEAAYVQYMLERLAPGPEEDSQSDPAARTAHLNRLAAFTALLSPVHISLHAAVLYARLAFDLTQGVWNRDLFIAYLRTPRSGGYVNQKFIERHANRRNPVDVLATFAPAAGLAAIGDDEPLVRQYLAHFLATASDGAAFAEWIDDDYLKRLFAETKLLAGAPEGERFTALLAPSEYQSRRDRVDLIFTPTNRSYFGPEDAVVIELAVKNVKTLFVKVFEINTENFYRERGVEIDTSFNVDGLVPHEERVLERLAPPLLRTAERITFPDLQGRGVYLIELIGGGRSCRALIRKGQLRFVETRTPAGHEFRVLDENGAPLKDATLWIEGRSFAAEKTGVIRVPFTRQPGLKSAVLCQAGFATLVQFNHVEERYDLKVGIHLERETLRPRAQATALIRAGLTLAGTPVSLDLLENVALTLETRDLEGTPAQRKVENFKLFEDREATFDFQVPDRLAMVALRLTAEVPNISQGRRDAVSALAIFDLNGIDTQPLVEDIFISRMGAGAVAEGGAEYILELLGRSGEPRQRRPVSFNLKHRDFVEEIHLTLQTDARGRIELGRLEGIARFTATGPEGRSQSWTAPRDRHSLPSTIHARVGETVQIPWSGPVDGLAGGPVRADGPAERADLALFERRGDAILRDCLPQAAIRRGLVEIRGLEAGDYDLYLKPTGARIALKVSAGIDVAGTLLARTRQLERINPRPLQIAALEADGKALTIRLANATRFARVHVAVSRFLPQYPLFENLNRLYFAAPGARQCVAPESQYLSTRNLGDEYTYVIERKYAAKRPGNLWTRPGLLLQPWSLRKTTTDRLDVAEGEAPMAMPSRSAPAQDMIADGDVASLRMGLGENGDATPNLDFLGEPAVLLVNLQADKNGVVTVPLADWGAHQHIVVAAVDPENTAVRMLSLPERSATVVDLRLIEGLDPQKKFAQQQEITLLSAGKSFRIGDLRTSTFEIYDCTSKLYRLFATLLKDDATFLEFGFVARWSDLPPEEKSEKYSRYACHELNYFLFRKDPAFFEKVIRPYLANKMDKTFLDRWLLEENLAAFLAPWAYGRLNVFERILLARRIDGEGPITARGVADAAALVPPDVEGFNQRFDTALKGGALETGDPYGVGAALQEAEKSARDAMPAPASMSAPLGAMMAAYGAGGAAGKDESTRAHRISRGGPSADDGMFGEPDGPPSAGGAPAKAAKRFAAKKQARAAQREFFRDLDQTEEWAENNYYRHPIEAQNADLIPTNAFWREFAAWNGKGAFLSEHAAAAAGSYTEALLALAVIDLPFAPTAHEAQVKGVKFSLTAGSDAVIFHREIKPAEAAKDPAPILISQNFFRHSDRFEYIDDEQVEKYVTEEFLTHVVYGLHVVVTNPTSARQRLDLLVQIPTGALAVLGSRATHSKHLAIDAFETVSHEVYFYFPAPGQFGHFPVHASRDGRVVAAASAVTLNVVREPSRVDTQSWDYLSQHGSDREVLAFLEKNNLLRVQLDRIAFRMQDAGMFAKTMALLRQRHRFEPTLYSYALRHRAAAEAREVLLHADDFIAGCGSWIDAPLYCSDPVARRAYQHLEYSPLVNARTHALGKRRQIANDRLHAQYHALLDILAHRTALDDEDRLSVVYYLLLQDRIDEGAALFAAVDPARLPGRLQYDYLAAYLEFFQPGQGRARALIQPYLQYPVERWHKIFQQAAAQLAEIDGKPIGAAGPAGAENENRDERLGALAATEPAFECRIDGGQIHIEYRNLHAAEINFYRMDIEMLFSRSPFVDADTGQFGLIRPNHALNIELPAAERSRAVPLPAQFSGQNVMVEVAAGGIKRTQAWYAHTLTVQAIEAYGQVKVSEQKTGHPIAAAYVKVYARGNDGAVRFFKDGYTDPRGRFDYASVSGDGAGAVARFAVLVLSDDHGAVVKEVGPPKQ